MLHVKRKIILSSLLYFILIFLASAQEKKADKSFEKLTYRNVGPSRGGRSTAVEGIESVPGTFFMGTTGGGLWKTVNYGNSWENISDGFFSTGSIGAIDVSKSNPKVVYCGTGSDGIRSNIISGKGVYKSEDGGKKWQHIGLDRTGQIGAVEIHPDNENIVFVAAIGQAFNPGEDRGVYRTLDGGKSWDKVLYISDSTGFADLEFSPDDPNTIYAAAWQVERKPWTIVSGGRQGGIYKSIDGGANWKKLKDGLPEGLIGKIDLSVSKADPNRLYALVEAPEGKGGLYRSDNRGESFVLISTKKELLDRPFYYCNIDVNPQNADVIYVSATQFWKSKDGGKTWQRKSTPHGDNHGIWINPSDTSIAIQANDGGANITLDGGKSWSTQNNQSTAELYQVEVDDQYPYWLYAGQQDNSTIAVPSLPPYSSPSGLAGYWISVGGCETGPAVPKPGNPNIIYSNCKGRFGVYDKRTGQEKQYYVGATNIYGHNPKDLKFRFQRVSPIHVSPHNPDVVYHTSQYVHKTTDDGKTWEIISPDLTAFEADKQVISGSPITRDVTGEEYYSTIYSIRESAIKKDLIWVGANDGPVHVTRDGGKSWNNVTPSSLEGGGRINCVEPSSHREGKAYFTSLRYQLGDWKPYLYKTLDYGATWELITDGKNGIPEDYPVRVVREDPDKEGILYAGTEYGMFISPDDGIHWYPFQQNLPITPITDIKVYRKDLLVSTMGRGFWIVDDISVLHEPLKGSTTFLSQPKDTYRYRYSSGGENGINFPSAGVIVDYYLNGDTYADIRMEISNAEGNIIRSFTKTDEKGKVKSAEVKDMATGFTTAFEEKVLTATSGYNRIVWDMCHQGAWTSGNRRRKGPLAAPGSYTVRLIVDGVIYQKDFKLFADPRILESGITVQSLSNQEKLNIQVRNLQSLTNYMSYTVSERKKELEKITRKGSKIQKELAAIHALDMKINTEEGRYMVPMLADQVNYLASMLGRADQEPGKDAYERYYELLREVKSLIPDWEKTFKQKIQEF